MSDLTPSGNRWETTPDGAVTDQGSLPEPAGPVPSVADEPEGRRGRFAELRHRIRFPGGRGWKVAAASALFIGAAGGGFAVGHATADQHDHAFPGAGDVRGFDVHGAPGQYGGPSQGQVHGQPGVPGADYPGDGTQ